MQGVKGLCPALNQTVHSTSCRNRCRGPVTVRAEDKPELLPKPTLSPKPQRRPAPQQQRQAPARDVQQYKQPPQDGNGNGVGRQQGQKGRGFNQQQSFDDGRGSNGAGRGFHRTDTFQRQPSNSGRGRNFDSQQQQRPDSGAANGGQHRGGPGQLPWQAYTCCHCGVSRLFAMFTSVAAVGAVAPAAGCTVCSHPPHEPARSQLCARRPSCPQGTHCC